MNLKTTFNIIVPVTCDDYNRNDLAHVEQYFTSTPVKRSAQLDGSPLVDENNSPIKACLELQQVQRKNVGIHANERHMYTLVKGQLDFQLRKIKLWIFNTNIAFFTIEVHTNEMNKDKVLDLVAELSNIKLNRKIDYVYNIDKDITEIKTFTLKELIVNLLTLQNVIPLKEIREETFQKAHCLFYGFNSIEDKEELSLFLEMLRCQNKSDRITSSGLNSENKYEPATYITWAISENVMAAIGNTYSTSPDNERFIVEPGGFVQTIFSNYIAVYLNCLSVYLKLRAIKREHNINNISTLPDAPDKAKYELYNLLNTPFTGLTNEMHINKLFDFYLCDNALGLNEDVKIFSDGSVLEYLKQMMEEMLKEQKEFRLQLDSLKSFMQEDLIGYLGTMKSTLGNYIQESVEKEFANLTQYFEKERRIASQLNAKADFINRRTESSDVNGLVRQEKEHLKNLFGKTWTFLDEITKSSLCSAGVLWKACADIKDKNFDYSGVCISATSALELEIKRCFYFGFQEFLQQNYGTPSFDNWPEMLLKNENGEIILEKGDGKDFTIGSLPYLLGKRPLNNIKNESHRLAQGKLLKEKVEEYLKEVMVQTKNQTTCREILIDGYNNLVYMTETIRTKYRNPAAHSNSINRIDAQKCYVSVVGKIESFDYRDSITSLLIQLYELFDIQKVCQYLK